MVALAALTNALRLTGRDPESTRVVISGAGAAGVAVARILLEAGIKDLAVADRKGVLNSSRGDLTPVKRALAALTADETGRPGPWPTCRPAPTSTSASRAARCRGAVASMAAESIIFGLANPNPEVHPDVAHRYARIVATGRSDFPNQINNVLAFPGIFRGAFDAHATAITEGMNSPRRPPWPAWSATTWPRTSSSPRRSTRGSDRRCRPPWPRPRVGTGVAPASVPGGSGGGQPAPAAAAVRAVARCRLAGWRWLSNRAGGWGGG